MTKLFLAILVSLLLTVPVLASAEIMTSPNYAINGGRIVSGGSSATDTSGVSKAKITIGQGVYMPPGGSSSPGYVANPVASGGTGGVSGVHSGDINGDGVVDIVDALLALKAGVGLVQLSGSEITRGDVGPLVNGVPVGDGRIEIEDTILILRKAVGLAW